MTTTSSRAGTKTTPRTHWNLILGLVNAGWSAVVALAVVPVILHYLGLGAYGLIGFFAALQAVLAILDMGLSPTTIASKAHRLELPRRDPSLLLQAYDPAKKAAAAHLFRGLVKRRCRHSGRWFWAQRNGPHTSREATKSAGYRDLIGGLGEASVASRQTY